MLHGWYHNSLLPPDFVRGLQATFLMVFVGCWMGLQSNEELDGSLEESASSESDDALRLRCKYNGLCNYGSHGQLLMRLSVLDRWVRCDQVRARMTQKTREGDESKRDWDFIRSDRGQGQDQEREQEQEQEIKAKPSPDPELDGEPLSVSDYEESFIPVEVDFQCSCQKKLKSFLIYIFRLFVGAKRTEIVSNCEACVEVGFLP